MRTINDSKRYSPEKKKEVFKCGAPFQKTAGKAHLNMLDFTKKNRKFKKLNTESIALFSAPSPLSPPSTIDDAQ